MTSGTGWSNLDLGTAPGYRGETGAGNRGGSRRATQRRHGGRAVVGLASAVGFSVVAEGVERPDTTLELARLGVDAVQGFGIARPMAESLVDPWLLGQLASAAGVQKPLR